MDGRGRGCGCFRIVRGCERRARRVLFSGIGADGSRLAGKLQEGRQRLRTRGGCVPLELWVVSEDEQGKGRALSCYDGDEAEAERIRRTVAQGEQDPHEE